MKLRFLTEAVDLTGPIPDEDEFGPVWSHVYYPEELDTAVDDILGVHDSGIINLGLYNDEYRRAAKKGLTAEIERAKAFAGVRTFGGLLSYLPIGDAAITMSRTLDGRVLIEIEEDTNR